MVPTISSISPSIGHTGGSGLVEILGSGFQTWTIPPPSNGPAGEVWPTVEVLFGGAPGTRVAVVSSSRLFVVPPPSPLPGIKPAFGEGAVDVTVRNIDEHGAVIGLESATAAGAFTYQRQQLATDSELTRLVHTLIRELRKQVIPNVSVTTHSDFDIDTADLLEVVDVASLPALVIFGPSLQENRFFSLNGMVATANGPDFELRPAPRTDDLLFSFVGISDLKVEALNLQASVRAFFKNNSWLVFQRDPTDASRGTVKYDMDLDAAGITPNPSADQKSNLRSFSGSFVVRGFDHEDLAGFPGSDVVARTRQVNELSVSSSQKDG